MAGIFGNSPEDRHFESRLMAHLNDEHHPKCPLSEEIEEQVDEDGNYSKPLCTCADEYSEDECEAKLSRMED